MVQGLTLKTNNGPPPRIYIIIYIIILAAPLVGGQLAIMRRLLRLCDIFAVSTGPDPTSFTLTKVVLRCASRERIQVAS